MQSQRWIQIADLFTQLTELPVDQRTAFIQRVSGDDGSARPR
jgi:hypothetical protein